MQFAKQIIGPSLLAGGFSFLARALLHISTVRMENTLRCIMVALYASFAIFMERKTRILLLTVVSYAAMC